MARSLLAPFAPRSRRATLMVLPMLVLALSVGCGSRRALMRPVYIGPSRSCPSGNCGGTIAPASPSSTTTTIVPSSVEPVGPASEAPLSVTPKSLDSTPPPVSGPALPSGPEEPELKPAGGDDSSTVTPPKSPAPSVKPSGSGKVGSINPAPSARILPDNGRRTASGRSRSASSEIALTSFVDNPDDLIHPPKADRPWKYIVLHHSANPSGSYDTIDVEHRERLGWKGCGYHFVIGNGTGSGDGQIEISERWLNQKHGVHCRDGKTPDANEYGIGICLVGDLEKSPPTPRQIAAARALVAYLSTRYHIAADHAETHKHLANSQTTCPGRMFPTQAILGTKNVASIAY